MLDTMLFGDCISFKDLSGRDLLFVRFGNPDKLLVWEKPYFKDGFNESICKVISVKTVDVDTLKTLNVWGKLSEDAQKEIYQRTEQEKADIIQGEQPAMFGRKLKYPDIPKEIDCSSCGCAIKIVPSIIGKRLEKSGISIEDYLKTFQCQKCKPVKEVVSEKISLVCIQCGKNVSTTNSQVEARAAKKSMTVEYFTKQFQCQTCNPTKGAKKGSGSNSSKPELVCVKCGSKTLSVLPQMKKRAEKLNLSVEDFVKQFECQKCHPTKGRPKKDVDKV